MEYEMSAKGTTLNSFITLVRNNGLSKSSHFSCNIKPPLCLEREWGNPQHKDAIGKYSILCKTAQLPGITLASMNHEEYGETREIPYQKQYSNLPLTYILDIDLDLRRFFQDWMDYIIDPVSRTHGYYDNYVTTLTLDVDDSSSEKYRKKNNRKNSSRYKVQLFEAYPKSIEPINLDYSATGFAELSVSINYKYYKIIG